MMQVLSSLRDSASIHCPKIKTGKIENLKSDKLISMQGINLEKVPHTNPPFQLPRQKGISYDLDSSMMLNMQKSVCQVLFCEKDHLWLWFLSFSGVQENLYP